MATLAKKPWYQTALFDQLTLCNFLNGRNNLGPPELRATVALMTKEQRVDAFVFLKRNKEELAGISNGGGIQTVANVLNHWTILQ